MGVSRKATPGSGKEGYFALASHRFCLEPEKSLEKESGLPGFHPVRSLAWWDEGYPWLLLGNIIHVCLNPYPLSLNCFFFFLNFCSPFNATHLSEVQKRVAEELKQREEAERRRQVELARAPRSPPRETCWPLSVPRESPNSLSFL